jgi:predicted nucleic acid-binding protein
MINLARIEVLHLLAELYETVVLPEAVWTEIVVEGEGQPGARAVQSATWIERQAVANRDLVRALRQDVDKGEAKAVALAVETEDVLLLMDERRGRETADHFDLACVGLIGVLIEAKENEHVDALRPYLQTLRSEAGCWISDQLDRRVLRDEGELP